MTAHRDLTKMLTTILLSLILLGTAFGALDLSQLSVAAATKLEANSWPHHNHSLDGDCGTPFPLVEVGEESAILSTGGVTVASGGYSSPSPTQAKIATYASEEIVTDFNPASGLDVNALSGGLGLGFRDTRLGLGGGGIRDLIAADLDGDGFPEVVTAEANGIIRAWRNNGSPFDGEWSEHQLGVTAHGWGVLTLAAGDLDGDGDIDLAVGRFYDYGPIIWENDGSPFDGEWRQVVIGEQTVGALEIADIDVDGDEQAERVVVAGGGLPWASDTEYATSVGEDYVVTIWRPTGNPFNDPWESTEVGGADCSEPGAVETVYCSIQDLAVGDLDGDGRQDIVIGTYHAPAVADRYTDVDQSEWINAYQVRAFRNDGGSWTGFNVGRDPEIETLPYLANLPPPDGPLYHNFYGATVTSVTLVDLDDDGDLDIVATESLEGDFLVMGWQNDGTPFSGKTWQHSAIAKGEDHNWLHDDVWWAEPGDFDLDGDIDLVVGCGPMWIRGLESDQQPDEAEVIAWENTGVAFGFPISQTAWMRHDVGVPGRWVNPDYDVGPSSGVWAGAVADFDQDGDLDIVAANYVDAHPQVESEIRIWENYPVRKVFLPLVMRSGR